MKGWKYLQVALTSLLLSVGCTDTPQREDEPNEAVDGNCSEWEVAVVVDNRLVCVSDDVLEREREIIELDDDW